MSRIPSPPTRQKPKSVGKASDVQSDSHAALLQITWQKLDALVAKLYSFDAEKCEAQRKEVEARYRTRAKYAAEDALKRAAKFTDGRQAALSALGQAVAAMGQAPLPTPESSLFVATVSKRTLEKPISVEKGPTYAPRMETVGFVDIACALTVPTTLELEEGLPYFLDKKEPTSTELMLSDWHAEHHEREDWIRQQEVSAPTWRMKCGSVVAWIDIRVQAVPVGQLLRELKTLQEFAPYESQVLVVMESVEPGVQQMLAHEGFLVLSRAWLEALP